MAKTPDKPWKETFRDGNGMILHRCKHNFDHPARGSVHYTAARDCPAGEFDDRVKLFAVHECDGCCESTKWRLADLEDSSRHANLYLIEYQERYDRAKAEANWHARELALERSVRKFSPYLGIGQI